MIFPPITRIIRLFLLLALTAWGAGAANAMASGTHAADGALRGPVLRTHLDTVRLHPNTKGRWTGEQRRPQRTTALDLAGRVAEETFYRLDGGAMTITRYAYDELGRLESRATEGTGAGLVRCQYDAKGRRAVEIHTATTGALLDKLSYSYDRAGRLMQTTQYSAAGAAVSWCVYAYNARGHKTQETLVWPGVDGGRVVRAFDADDRVVEAVNYSPKGVELSRQTFLYSPDTGLCTQETLRQTGGAQTKTRYVYEMDHYGNWVTRASLVWNTRNDVTTPGESLVEHRSITYGDFTPKLMAGGIHLS